MSVDNEILQEFLVEAGELYEQLGDKFVELEKNSQDSELLNAIFRAFHTIKGGAGFMNLQPLVEICHGAEDVINLLRDDKLQVSVELMDVFFQTLDSVGAIFDAIHSGEELADADSALLGKLKHFSNPQSLPDAFESDEKPSLPHAPAEADKPRTSASAADMDAEFEAMLEKVQIPSDVSGSRDDGDITEGEFDELLDKLHGKGQHGVLNQETEKNNQTPGSDLITYDEFEAILDSIHGTNKGPGGNTRSTVTTSEPEKEPKEGKVRLKHPEKSDQAADKKQTKSSPSETSVRVDTSRLDDIVNLVGELVLVRNRLSTLKHMAKQDQLIDAISDLELVTSDLQASVMKTRMQPIRKVFSRFPRVVRDLARQLDKDICLELVGEDTDIDKSLVEALADPLIHLVRNAIDHGIETPGERISAGKQPQGKVVLSAKQQGDQILLSVCDDGKGMDPKALRNKVVKNGVMTEEAAERLNDRETFNLIFAPGFSTKAEVTDVSGRGVGMDVVKTRITELNGSIEIDSELGQGSVITIRLPLTLAIVPTLMVTLGGYQFALPLTNVNESFNMEAESINAVDGQVVIRVHEKSLPLYYLDQWLAKDAVFDGPERSRKVVVVQMGSQQFCLVVDHIIGQEEVVIKPLGTLLCNIPGISGATITGDGSIALILDMPTLMDTYA